MPASPGSSSGTNVARLPSRRAISRTTSRMTTARSAAWQAGAGATGTSNWRLAYSGKKRSGSTSASTSAAISSLANGSAARCAASENGSSARPSPTSWNSCSKLAWASIPSCCSRAATMRARNARGQHAQGRPSSSTMSQSINSSALAPGSAPTLVRVCGSGSRRRSPVDPNGLGSASGPSGVRAWLAGTHPTPRASGSSSSEARTARPRTIAPRSQITSETSSAALTRAP